MGGDAGKINVTTAWERWSDSDRLPVLAVRSFAGVRDGRPVRGLTLRWMIAAVHRGCLPSFASGPAALGSIQAAYDGRTGNATDARSNGRPRMVAYGWQGW